MNTDQNKPSGDSQSPAPCEEQIAELQQQLANKSATLATLSHDVRSLVAGIRDSLGHIQQAENSPAAEVALTVQTLLAQVDRLQMMAEDLLGTAADSSQPNMQTQRVSVRAFLTAELPFLRQIGARKRTRVVLEPIDAGHLIAHPTRIRRVLDNLVSNAVKFSPCGSTIFIHAYQEGGYWRIWVQDQGPGIAPAERRKLFGKFARLSAQPTGQESSTGLGLHVCREIVQAHGGDIGVENAAGRGALFWFTLKDATGEADAHLETGDASGCRDIVPPTSE